MRGTLTALLALLVAACLGETPPPAAPAQSTAPTVIVMAPPPAPPPPPPPAPALPGATVIEVTITAGLNVNPNAAGRPSPVVVDVFQLASPVAFTNVDYFQLTDAGAATLGEDVISHEEFVLSPGDVQKTAQEVPTSVHFVGVVAGYRDVENATWRAVVPVPAHQTTRIDARLRGNAVAVSSTSRMSMQPATTASPVPVPVAAPAPAVAPVTTPAPTVYPTPTPTPAPVTPRKRRRFE